MEALEKDFSDLVASEDAVETDTDQVTAEAGVEDIVQQILSANADQSVDEPTVAEEEETVAEEEETVEEYDEGMMSHMINEELIDLIKYRSERKWYSTISIIAIFAMILALMMLFVALGKDISEGWKEVLLVLIGAFVGSWSKVIDFWFNNAEQDNTLLENASD